MYAGVPRTTHCLPATHTNVVADYVSTFHGSLHMFNRLKFCKWRGTLVQSFVWSLHLNNSFSIADKPWHGFCLVLAVIYKLCNIVSMVTQILSVLFYKGIYRCSEHIWIMPDYGSTCGGKLLKLILILHHGNSKETNQAWLNLNPQKKNWF